MFFKPPEVQKNCFRFVYYPPGIDLDETKFTDLDEDGFLHAGTVLVPTETKYLVETFLGSILEIENVDIPLEVDIGTAIEEILDKLHNNNNCSKYCRCEFERERYWGHYIYQLILEAYARLIDVKKINLTDDIS